MANNRLSEPSNYDFLHGALFSDPYAGQLAGFLFGYYLRRNG
jgi:hypothetical protein